MKQLTSVLPVCILLCIALFSCNKKDNNTSGNPPATADSGKLYFHIHTDLGTQEVDDYNTVYTLDNGRKISLSLAQFYVSGIQLIKSDGSLYPLTGKVLLKVLETESYMVATVPTGTYKAVKFNIGLDAATNALDASADTILNHSEMWFGSTPQPGGYIFLNAQGKIDTTTDASGTTADMQPFVYKIGTTAHLMPVTMPDHDPGFTVTKDATEFVHLQFDYSALFKGVLINVPANLSVSSPSDNAGATGNIIANNITGAFSYEE